MYCTLEGLVHVMYIRGIVHVMYIRGTSTCYMYVH